MSHIVNVDVKAGGQLQKFLSKIKNLHTIAEVGFFEESTYHDGTPVAYVAYLNEFGNHNPPRPFMKRTFDSRHPAWAKLIQYVLRSKGLSKESMKEAFDIATNGALHTPGDYFRCAYRSLAESYRKALDELEENTGKKYDSLYIVGGGAKNQFLNNLTEASTGKRVIALPIEATALGNLKIQLEG